MKENNFYLKVGFVAIVIILLFAIIVNVSMFVFNWGVEKTNKEIIDVLNSPPFICEFKYGDIYYKGVCNDELLDGVNSLIVYDRRIETLKFCLDYPYAYRYELCKDLMEVN